MILNSWDASIDFIFQVVLFCVAKWEKPSMIFYLNKVSTRWTKYCHAYFVAVKL